MSDKIDPDNPRGPSGPARSEPLRIVGAEEAGTLVGLPDSDDSWAPGATVRSTPKPVFESVPDATDEVDDWAVPARRSSDESDSSKRDEVSAPDEDASGLGRGDSNLSSRPSMIASVPDAEPFVDVSQELELPHWTEPPTGQVPRVLIDETRKDDSWLTYASAPRWRDDGASGRDEDSGSSLADLAHDEPRVGALAERERPAIDEFFAFDELDDSEPISRTSRPRTGRRGTDRDRSHTGEHRIVPDPGPASLPGAPAARGGRNVPAAIGLGVGLAALALVLFRIGPGATMAFVLVLLGVGGAEFFDAARRGGYRPATLLGLTASVGLPAAVYWRGDAAYPIVGGLVVVAGLLWFLFGVDQEQVTADLGVTLLGTAYVGGFGSIAALILRAPGVDSTRILLGAIVPVVAHDVFAYTVGRNAGRTPLMPHVSPNKTVEGLVGGVIGAVVASLVFNQILGSNPWHGFGAALELGLVVAFMAPLGDLAESLIKRDLGIKDMGTILPGHGGVLDRFDTLLFVLPAVYFLALLLDVIPT